ncbi:MAG: hypothetical protein EAZ30_14685 [Betaproteobacteria bacterium]|nr:MAG: hypothetical protein EAZ30_14685 [Betaproteobacteria bacterium]
MAAALCLPTSAQVVAVLEHPQCRDDQSRVVRALFAKESGRWRSVVRADFSETTPRTWFQTAGTAASKTIQTIQASPPPDDKWLFARDFSLVPSERSLLPNAPNPESKFQGWCDAPKNRPVALTSIDVRTPLAPALPTAAALSAAQQRSLLRAFLRTYSSKTLCAYTDNKRTMVAPISIRTSDLVFRANLELPRDSRLVAVGLKRPAFGCNSEGGSAELPRWFVLDPQPRFLGASMQFIQRVPTSELGVPSYLFWYSGYNEDGYIMFDNRLQESTRFTWKYH